MFFCVISLSIEVFSNDSTQTFDAYNDNSELLSQRSEFALYLSMFPALMNTVYADLFGWKSDFVLLLFFCFLIKYTNNLNRFSGL